MKKTDSKSKPQIMRLQSSIIYPVGVEEVQIETEDGGTETHYRFYSVHLADYGDDITASDFAKKRYADLRRLSPLPHGYGTTNEQFEMMHEQGFSSWNSHCQQVKDNFPKS